MKGTKNIKQGCKRPYLSNKYQDKKKCTYPMKNKKKHFKKFKYSPCYFKKGFKMKYLKRKKFFGSNKSNRCYIYHKKGHFIENFPNKAQAINLVNYLAKKIGYDPNEEDVEFVFFLDEEPNSKTLMASKVEESSDDEAYGFYKVSPASQPNHLIPLSPV